MPKISVVIPVYNKAPYLKKCIDSVLQQDFNDFEVIVINDGSTDDSVTVLNALKHPRLHIFHQENQGVAKARNKGVDYAKGDIIAFLDADDYWYPNHLSVINDLSNLFPEASFFGTAYQAKYPSFTKDIVYPFKQKEVLLDKFYKYAKGPALFYTSNFAIKRPVFVNENGFKPNIDSEDTEFFIRLGIKYQMAYSKLMTMVHINNAMNSLFKQYHLDRKIRILDFFTEDTKNDPALKAYLDLHRFAWIMEAKLTGQSDISRELFRDLDWGNLNTKQKILVKLPNPILKVLKILQNKLKEKGYYLSSFSKS